MSQVEIVRKYLSEGYDLGYTIRYQPRFIQISCTLTKNGNTYSFGTRNDYDLMWFLLDLEIFPDPYTGKPKVRVVKDKESLRIADEALADFLSAKEPCFPVVRVSPLTSESDQQRISVAIRGWIECESVLKEHRTSLPLAFYNVLVLQKNDGIITQSIFEKDKIQLASIHELRKRKSECEWIKCFSGMLLCPKISAGFSRDYVLGMLLYDAFSRRIETGILGTARSLLNIYGRRIRKGRELADLAVLLTQRMLTSPSEILLSSPFRDSEFSPTTWIVYSISSKLPCEYSGLEPKYAIHPCEALVFGDPGVPRERSSFDFKRRGQTAYVGLEIEATRYVIRFDCQGREPKFHIHYEIRAKSWKKTILSHYPISLGDMWKLDRNLCLSFLSATIFDGRFNDVVRPNIKDLGLVQEEPIAALPLRIVMELELEEEWLGKNPECMTLLQKFWNKQDYSPTKDEEKWIDILQRRGLLVGEKLSVLASMVLARNIQ